MQDADQKLRIDRWLYYCRLFKTRTRATDAVAGGHVRLNGERPSPGARVRVGDCIEVVRIPARRGPAAEARACYAEDEATVDERQARLAALRQDRQMMPRTRGRPDKHTRRALIRRNRG